MIERIIVKSNQFDSDVIYELWVDHNNNYYYWVDVSYNNHVLPELFDNVNTAKRWLIRMCDEIGASYTERS